MPNWAQEAGIDSPNTENWATAAGIDSPNTENWATAAGIDINTATAADDSGRGFLGVAADVGRQFVGGIQDIVSMGISPEVDKSLREIYTPEGQPKRYFPKLDKPKDPDNIFESAARLGGQAAAAGPVIGKLVSGVSAPLKAATGKFGKAKDFIQTGMSKAGRSFSAAPIATTAIETGLGASAGAGGYIAGRINPDSPATKFTGELIGGILPAILPASFTVGAIKHIHAILRKPFTDQGGRDRVIARLQRAVNKDEAVEAIKELEGLTTIDSSTGKPVLGIPERSGNQGLLALKRAVSDSSEELTNLSQDSISRSNKVLQDQLQDIGGGNVIDTELIIEGAQRDVASRVDKRIEQAIRTSDKAISDIRPNLNRELSNVAASEEINTALMAARKQEKTLYDVVPQDTPVGFSEVEAAYNQFKDELGSAQLSDMPGIAGKYLNKKASSYFGEHKNVPEGLGDLETTIKEIRALQSKLRGIARNARAGDKKNLNMARMSDGIADAITRDIEQTAVNSVAVRDAVSFSRNLNQRFGSKTLAKVLKRTASGAKSVDKSLLLDETLGLSGPKARQHYDDLIKAFDSQESPDSRTFVAASQEYILGRFLKESIDSSVLNGSKASNFINRNSELLERMPSVAAALDFAVKTGKTLALRTRQKSRLFLGDPRVSKAAMFIEKGPVEMFEKISKLKPSSMLKETRKLINLVNRDTTGEALAGLKTGYIEYLLKSSRGKVRDKSGRELLSGYAIRDAFNKTKGILKPLLSNHDIRRIKVITKDLINLEKSIVSKASKEGVIGDVPGKLMNALAGYTGVALASTTRSVTGSPGSILIPAMLSKTFRGMLDKAVTDPASKLIRDALTDEKLFKELLQSTVSKTGKMTVKAVNRLNIWAGLAVAEYGESLSEEP